MKLRISNNHIFKLGYVFYGMSMLLVTVTILLSINTKYFASDTGLVNVTKENGINENLFNNLNLEEYGWNQHSFDATSRTNSSVIIFPTNSKYESFIRVICYDWSKKSGYDDQLRIELISSEYYEWLSSL